LNVTLRELSPARVVQHGSHARKCRVRWGGDGDGAPDAPTNLRGPGLETRTHDRCVGVCYLDGADISEAMVHRRVARDCPRYSQGRYAEAEREAAADGATIGRVYALPGYCRRR
jgi:hypothetical protein